MKVKLVLSLWATAFVMAACESRGTVSSEDSSKLAYSPEVNEVDVVTLRRQVFQMQLVANGKLSAAQRSSLYFDQSGQIVTISVDNGSRVNKGDIIARIDDTEQHAALEMAHIELDRTRLEYLDFLAGLGYAFADTASVPDDVRKIAGIRSGYTASRSNCEKARRELAGTILRAPFAGKVADMQFRLWDQTGSGPFCSLIDDRTFDVTFSALESEYAFLEPGQTVHVTPFGQDRSISGRIRSINPTVDRNGQISVTASIAGGEGLLDGMNVKVIVDRAESGQLVVPKSAVVIRDGEEVLFRYRYGKAEWVYVHTVRANSDSYAVTANAERGAVLEEGDQVIVSGNLNLADGSRVVAKQ